MNNTASTAISVSRSGSFHLSVAPHLAFPLFTAPGETLWVEGWEPAILSGNGVDQGSVFMTDIGEKTYWIVIEFDRETCHARYARVAPESRAGTVDVRLESDGKGGSLVTVTYELTGLSARGNAMLEEFDQEAYAAMLLEWESAIRDADIEYPVGLASELP